MSFLSSLQVYEKSVEPAEYQRLRSLADHSCPECSGPIHTGEVEAAGICTNCYFMRMCPDNSINTH